MTLEEKYLGFPIPIEYINPNLKFYPLILPSANGNVVYYGIEHYNNTRMNVKLTRKDNLKFIDYLLSSLNRTYIIFKDILIDLDRQDYEIKINENAKKIEFTSNNDDNNKQYICIKLNKFDEFTSMSFPTVDYTHYYNDADDDQNNDKFIKTHCKRILKGTKMIQESKMIRNINSIIKLPSTYSNNNNKF